MESRLHERGLSLEEAFFRKRDAELIEQQRKLEKIRRTRESLAEISGIKNDNVLDRLVELEVTPSILSSLVVIPLVEVAWADGKIDKLERKAVLAGASENGIKEGSPDYALLDAWLGHRPPNKLLNAWTHYIQGVCELMSAEERRSFKNEILDRAKRVAAASGGILGLAIKISAQERAILKTLEKAFSGHH